MSQVRAAVGANGFGARHSHRAVYMLLDRAYLDFFREAGPAAAGVEFGRRVEQLGVAADAAVAAFGVVTFMFAGEWALGRGVAADLEGGRFRAFFSQQGFPFGIGFLDFWRYFCGHELLSEGLRTATDFNVAGPVGWETCQRVVLGMFVKWGLQHI